MSRSKSNKLDQTKSSDATTQQKFKPTPHMIAWLDTQIRMGTDVIDHIAEESGIQESTWYYWLKKPGFEDWYWEEYDRRTRRWKPTIDQIGLKYAREGSPSHFEYLAKRVGNSKDKDEDPNVAVQVNNNLLDIQFTTE